MTFIGFLIMDNVQVQTRTKVSEKFYEYPRERNFYLFKERKKKNPIDNYYV